ncbi:MAG TPA: right-handed parallel beta-helix repeat-containing protein, partial [Solirubrobacterales bacterium]|nr:right-handed parallel beta-helix repeat-containing protein [Solirubrobacterales bacterium]
MPISLSRSRCAAILVALIAALAVTPSMASATVLPTTISENMTLTAAGSPYTGTSTTVSEGVTVTVEPGTLVKLTGTLASKGTLDVNGTAEAPAVFTSSSDSAPGQWTGIVLQAGAGASSIRHAEIRHGKTGIALDGSISPTIESSSIHDNGETGIAVSGGGAPEIADNAIVENAYAGITFSYTGASSQLDIHDNLVEGNKAGGIRVASSGATALTHVDFSGNEVEDNLGRAIYFEGPTLPPDLDENLLSGN